MEAYLQYTSRPNGSFTGFADYNAKFKSNLTLNNEVEKQVKSLVEKARAQFGPNEVVPMSYFQSFLSSCKKDGNKITKKKMPAKAKQTLSEALKEQGKPGQVTDIIFESLEKEVESPSKCNICQEENCAGHVEDIEFEDEYGFEDNAVETNIREFLSQSLSGDDLEQAHKHIIYFDRKEGAMGDKLMKGKDRYMKALRSFMKGDMSAEIRLMSKQKVKVADLKLNKESLEAMMKVSPGKPRFCECEA